MRTKQGYELSHKSKVTEYGGSRGYAFWQADCFQPRIWFVRADNFADAYANFICHLPAEDMTYPTLDAEQAKTYTNLLATLQGVESLTSNAEYDAVEALYNWLEANGFEHNDNGDIVFTENVQGVQLWGKDEY